jgi:site-specific DNA recombinase
VLKRGPDACPAGAGAGGGDRGAVLDHLRRIFPQPEIVVGTWRAARAQQEDIIEGEAGEARGEVLNLLEILGGVHPR